MPNYPQTAPNPKKLNLNDVLHVPMQHPSHHVVSMSACQTLEKRGTEFACWIDVSSIVFYGNDQQILIGESSGPTPQHARSNRLFEPAANVSSMGPPRPK